MVMYNGLMALLCCLAALGFRTLSMRPASIGPVKSLLRRTDLGELRAVLHEERARGTQNLRPAATDYLRSRL